MGTFLLFCYCNSYNAFQVVKCGNQRSITFFKCENNIGIKTLDRMGYPLGYSKLYTYLDSCLDYINLQNRFLFHEKMNKK